MCTGSSLGSMAVTASTSCILSSAPLDWRCDELALGCIKVDTMFRGPTFFADSPGVGITFSAFTVRWPTAGRCTTIRNARRDYWRKVDEVENACKPNTVAELCRWRRACFTPGSKGRAKNCANVRHADLHLGKGQSRCEKAIRVSGFPAPS